MQTFFCRLNAPRPSFTRDMTAEERALMGEHAAYWRDRMTKGEVIAFGLVADPAGAFGIGIVQLASEAEAQRFTAQDPVMKANRGFRYDIHPMPLGAVHRGG
jgi:hypothetical protein